MVTLEDKAEMLPAQARQRVTVQRGDVHSRHPVAAAGGFIQAAKDIHQGRFTRAGCAHDGHHLTGDDIQGDTFQHLNHAFA